MKIIKMIKKIKKIKGIVLFSGGLDSVLAVKLAEKSGLKLIGLHFKSIFIPEADIKEIAEEINLPVKIIEITSEQIKIVKKPRFGYGKNLNPCLDCRLLMLEHAKREMKKQKAEIIVTGEVVGQRPFSQNRNSLAFLEKTSKLKGKILRPLSAKLLPLTDLEKKSLIKRDVFLGIKGRSRQIQLKLAEDLGIKRFLSPAGGCLLTNPSFAQRLKQMVENWPDFNEKDCLLLKVGRHFWEDKVLFVVGRDFQENKQIGQLFQKGDYLISGKGFPGPSILVRFKQKKDNKEFLEFIQSKAKELISRYAHKKPLVFDLKINY